MAMRTGPSSGCLVAILDMVKAAAPVLVFRWLAPDTEADLVAGAAVILGHNFPAWWRFRGGRGVSPLFGVLAVVDWVAIPVVVAASLVVGLVVLADPYFSYAAAPVFLVPWFWWRFGWGPEVVFALVVNVFYWTATIPELRAWIGYRRRSRRPRMEFRKGFAGMVLPGEDEP
jgi:glycerol-3-phosphate acyltransferase PlsY